MRSICDMDTTQIEITNTCINSCANCSRFCTHVKKPFFMEFDLFKEAIDSMVGYPKMCGIQGGEPLLHPDFEKMCEYASSKIPKKQLGLWTTLPKGFEHYREIICKTFYHIFVNDHTREDIFHHPALVAVEEVIPDKNKMWNCIDNCWAQESWSASINPKGAWFCEIAASMSILFNEGIGWKVEPGWWWRIPKDFTSQMEQFCPRCGFSVAVNRRKSTDIVDDISPKNLERLKGISRRVDKGDYIVHNLQTTTTLEPLAAYKDLQYRSKVASRYGILLFINEYDFWTPYLKNNFSTIKEEKSILSIYQDRMEK